MEQTALRVRESPVRPQKPGQVRCADAIGVVLMRSGRVLTGSINPFEMPIHKRVLKRTTCGQHVWCEELDPADTSTLDASDGVVRQCPKKIGVLGDVDSYRMAVAPDCSERDECTDDVGKLASSWSEEVGKQGVNEWDDRHQVHVGRIPHVVHGDGWRRAGTMRRVNSVGTIACGWAYALRFRDRLAGIWSAGFSQS